MLLQHFGILDGVEVDVGDHLAVQFDGDLPALRRHFLLIPFTRGLHRALLRGDHVVDAAVILRVAELAPLAGERGLLVEDLQLDAFVGGVAFARRADAEAVVRAFGRHRNSKRSTKSPYSLSVSSFPPPPFAQ